jgi:nonsense-mediated mRNA decay protein 3
MSGLVCPRCGRTSDQVEFIEAFCRDDYPVRLKLPEKIELEQCTRCERIRLRGEWLPYNGKKIGEYVVSKCRGDFESAEYDLNTQTATFSMRGTGSRVPRTVRLEIKKTICQQCSRISGGYYEAIIQLRGDPLKVRGHAEMLMKRLARKTFIAKEEEKDAGLDIYVGSSKAVVEVVTALSLKTLITKKLIGRDEGKRLYRTTFLIRL